MFTMDGWSDVMFMMRHAKKSIAYDIYFLAVVYIGGFFVLNLVAAIQFSYYNVIKMERDKKIEKKKDLERSLGRSVTNKPAGTT